jgi:hypothetical protein
MGVGVVDAKIRSSWLPPATAPIFPRGLL